MNYLVNNIQTLLNLNGALYCILFSISLSINKYILSSLKFNYPTVLQGWQTASTTLLIFLLKTTNKEKYKESVHAPGFTIFVPHLIFHVLQLVTGSRALSLLPVSVFLCSVSSSEALINLVLKFNNRLINLIGALVILASGTAVLWKYYEFTQFGACLWFVAYIAFFAADSVYCGLVDLKVNRFSKLFYINLFSAIALLPLSLYTNEIYWAVDFGRNKGLSFVVCFLASGVSSGLTQLLALALSSRKTAHTLASLLAAWVGHTVFDDVTVTDQLFNVVVLNLAAKLLLADESGVEYNKLEMELV